MNDYPLEHVFEVMKPCKVNKNNKTQAARLELIMKDDSDFIAAEKIDGCHYTAIGGRFFSTHIAAGSSIPVEKTSHFPHLTKHLQGLGQAIFDGEINFPGLKSQDVTTITGCHWTKAIERQKEGNWLNYKIFDILRLPDGTSLINKSWRVRRAYLESLRYELEENPHIQIEYITLRNKRRLLETVLDGGGEGIVLKNVDGLYVPGKRPMWNWVKVKTEIDDDVVIIGFEPAEIMYTGDNINSWPYWWDLTTNLPCKAGTMITDGMIPVTRYHYNGWIGAIVMGKYDLNGKLKRIGTCSGMDDAQRQAFTEHPEQYIGQVATIHAMELTRDGVFRHPSFKQMHPDKNAFECVI